MTDLHVHPPATRRWTLGRVLAAICVVGVVAMWSYVLFLAVAEGRQAPRDRVADPAFSPSAQEICATAHVDVAALPPAANTPNPTERAAIVTTANDRFARMLGDLDAIVPEGDDGRIVREWLADWRTYLGDRAAYARALTKDATAQLLVTPKDQQQVTEFIDAFAADNRIIACATPIDV